MCEFSKFQPDEQNSCPITSGIQIERDFNLLENGAKTNPINLMIVLEEKNALVEVKPKRQFTNKSIKSEALFSPIALELRVGRKAQENES